MYTHVHDSTIHNIQKVEPTQMSIHGWMDKQHVVHPYNGILFSPEKERNTDPGYPVGEPQKHYAKWTQLGQKTPYCMIPLIWNIQNK